MKKTKVMRLLSLLLVMTLISTCAISGTFAKYVTRASGEDTARVAKWGILVSVNGDSGFATQYETDDTTYEGDYSVISSGTINGTEKVVAPGTKLQPALSGGVTGTPEVATRYSITIKDWNDIVLPAETYTDYTEYVLGEGYTKDFTLAADYAPIKWDIVCKNAAGEEIMSLLGAAAKKLGTDKATLVANGVYGFSATEAKAIIPEFKDQLIDLLLQEIPSAKSAGIEIDGDDITIYVDFEPEKEVNYTFELQWSWAYEGPTATVTTTNISNAILSAEDVDKADTYLGNWIAGVDGLDASTAPNITATLIATATQID